LHTVENLFWHKATYHHQLGHSFTSDCCCCCFCFWDWNLANTKKSMVGGSTPEMSIFMWWHMGIKTVPSHCSRSNWIVSKFFPKKIHPLLPY
jgi:hypothetical protein